MNILVTGGNGQLGNELRLAASNCSAANYFSCSSSKNQFATSHTTPSHDAASLSFVFTDVVEASEESVAMLRKLGGEGVDTSTTKLDITDLDAIRAIVREHHIDVIVNCAAYTNVDAAEENQELAELLNAKAVENLAIAMKEVGGWLVQISTDYVFGKEPYNTPCKEGQKGTPTGVYGLTKLHGEQKIIASGCKHVIIRTAWLYSEFGKNFVRTMLNLTATRPQLKVVFDQTGTPTYAGDLASAIMTILNACAPGVQGSAPQRPRAELSVRHEIPDQVGDDGLTGIYHFSNEGVCSWYDFTKVIAKMAGNAACDIQPCHSSEFPSPVRRPAYSVLDKTKIKETFGLSIPYWTDSLRRCLSALL